MATESYMLRTAASMGRVALRPFKNSLSCRLVPARTALPQQRWRLGRLLGAGRGVACSAAPPATEAQPQQQEQGAVAAAAAGSGGFKSNAYPFTDIEAKWQAYWEANKTFRTPDIHELDTSKPKFYALDMFPYPRRVRS